ncbi:MAG: hypothetical protein JWP36_2254 [Paucimonas sp.]|nr:hypothetical protein [Paucimonas sp.]
MYMVYWMLGKGPDATAQAHGFDTSELKPALDFMEALRARQRDGEAVSFVTMCSEHPHAVGLAGVAETGPDYNWKKRRR